MIVNALNLYGKTWNRRFQPLNPFNQSVVSVLKCTRKNECLFQDAITAFAIPVCFSGKLKIYHLHVPHAESQLFKKSRKLCFNRALYLGKRAVVAATPEEKGELTLEALAELEQLFSANQECLEFHPLIVKAEVLKSIGEAQRSLDVLNLIKKRHAAAEQNKEKIDSLFAQLEQTNSQEARDQILLEMQAMHEAGVVIKTGHPNETKTRIDSLVMYTEVMAQKGEHKEALECFMDIFLTSGDLDGSQRHSFRELQSQSL